MDPKQTIADFDQFLAERGLAFGAIIIGGTALALLGVIARETRDCDVLHPALPPAIRHAAGVFASESRQRGFVLDGHWLNEGPATLAQSLPVGWLERTNEVFHGKAIVLRTLGRDELLLSKLFALCDRGSNIGDCIALAPTPQELDRSVGWLLVQDTNPAWPEHVNNILEDLRRRLGYGL